jgi:hypothetical protein
MEYGVIYAKGIFVFSRNRPLRAKMRAIMQFPLSIKIFIEKLYTYIFMKMIFKTNLLI